MTEETLTTLLQRGSLHEFESDERALIQEARAAIKFSHSPYSNFKVGCALYTKEGIPFSGANQENASYGHTICAERTTIVTACNHGYGDEIVKIAITAQFGTADDRVRGTPIVPCGACRQVMKEYEDLAGVPMVILMDCFDDNNILRTVGIENLLPLGFGPADLGVIIRK